MRLTVYLLLATVSVTRSQRSSNILKPPLISNILKPPLIFPKETLLDELLARLRWNSHTIGHTETTNDCKDYCQDTDSKVESDDEWRLPKNVIPLLYDLHLDVYVDTFQFTGTIEITVQAEKKTDAITLHSDALSIIGSPEIFINLQGFGRKIKWGRVLSVNEDKKHLTLTFNLSNALEAGKSYILKLNYKGEIRDDLYGFYRSSFKVGNETRWISTTHFEPTHARRAFPCFDEPNLRAEFDITITHDKKYFAISNMPLEKSERQKIGVKAVREMERFSNIRFSLPKIDHVAIPDFAIGAMENWGLITYRDYFLIKRNDSTSATKQKVPTIITHELSHQWFGNLVSVNWWSHAWMKEGFSTFFENHITEKITEGKFSLWNQFIPNAFQVALELDGNPSTSVAMTSKASTPEEISARFNGITYQKAGTVLRMFAEVLTIDKFRDGLRNYLIKKQYSSATPADLFKEWDKVSSETLPKDLKFTDFAKSWTEQGGVPVVNVVRNYETGEVTFTQQRYYDKKPECPCGSNTRWWIPLTWIYQNDNPPVARFEPKAWLRGDIKEERFVEKIDIAPNKWLLVNFNSIGYFRVNYDTKNWQLLIKTLNTNPLQLPTQNRAQLINDAFSVASSSRLDFAVALDTLIVLSKETTATVWKSATQIIMKLVDELGPTEAYPMLEEYGRNLFTGVYSTLGLEPHNFEEHAKSLLRFLIAPWACFFGVEQCVKDATEILKHTKDDLNSIHPDVVMATLCGAIRGADEETFWDIRKLVATVSRMTEKMLIITALGKCHPDDNLIKRHLEETLEENSVIPKFLKNTTFQQILMAPSKFRVGFDFMKENLDKVLSSLGKKDTTSLVVTLIKRLRSETHYHEVNDWLNANIHKLNDPENVTAELTASKSNTEWNTLHLSAVARWLSTVLGRNPPSSDQTTSPPPTELTMKPTRQPDIFINNAALTKPAPLIFAILCILQFIF